MPQFILHEETEEEDSPQVETATQYGTPEEPLKVINNLEGTPWKGTYYQQVLREDDSPGPLDLLLDPTLQQYRRINVFDMLLQGELDITDDGAGGISGITGEVLIYPQIVPNAGDHFVAKIGDGTEVIMVLSDIVRLNYVSTSAHTATVTFYDYNTSALSDNLDVKVVEEVWWSAEKLELSNNPLAKEQHRVVDISKLLRVYYDEFFDKYTETFLYPSDVAGEEQLRIYDPWVTEFLDKVIPRAMRANLPKARTYTVDNGQYKPTFLSVWDMLLTRTCYSMDTIIQQVDVVSTSEFSSFDVYYNVYSSPIDRVLWPRTKSTLHSSPSGDDPAKPFYVLSEAFYTEDSENYTDLDECVAKYLSGEGNVYNDLVPLVNNVPNLTPQERFHQIPVWFLLAMAAI